MPMLFRRGAVPLAFALGFLRPASARAQSAADKAAAQALFDDARKLASSGDWSAACPKYAESNRLDPGIGVKLYLAECYEKVGKTASAWAMFGEAEEYARRAGNPRASVAHQRAERLAPRIVQIVVAVALPSAGIVVRRDGEEVGAAQWGVPVPINPGPHVIGASAPGKASLSIHVDAKEGAGTVRVEVPALADEPSEPATTAQASAAVPPSLPPPPGADTGTPEPRQDAANLRARRDGRRRGGYCHRIGLRLPPKSKLDESNAGHCHDGNLCDATGVQLRSEAKSNALGSTVCFVVGGVGLAGGAALWLTSPRAATTVGLTPIVTERLAGSSSAARSERARDG